MIKWRPHYISIAFSLWTRLEAEHSVRGRGRMANRDPATPRINIDRLPPTKAFQGGNVCISETKKKEKKQNRRCCCCCYCCWKVFRRIGIKINPPGKRKDMKTLNRKKGMPQKNNTVQRGYLTRDERAKRKKTIRVAHLRSVHTAPTATRLFRFYCNRLKLILTGVVVTFKYTNQY